MSERKFKCKFDFEKIGSYEAAERVPEAALSSRIMLLLEVAFDVIVLLLMDIPFMIYRLIEWIIMPSSKRIKGELAVVTGSGNGLGRDIVLELVRHGAQVAIVDVDGAAAERTAQEALELTDKLPINVKAYQADVSSRKNIAELKSKIFEDFGKPVSILINNAAIIPTISISNGTEEQIMRIIDVNLTSLFWTIRAFIPSMKENNHGHIVNISSICGLVGCKWAVVYSATKFGIRGLSEALDWELNTNGYDGICVSTVFPYFMATRKHLSEIFNLRIPAQNVEKAAAAVVKGMLQNKREICIPTYIGMLLKLSRILPVDLRQSIIDKFCLESIE